MTGYRSPDGRRAVVNAGIGAQGIMGDKRMKNGLKAIFVMFLAALMSGCGEDTPEDRLRQVMAQMEEAVEARRPSDFIEHVSDDFSGESGQLDRDNLRRYLASQMMGPDSISVVMGPAEIKLHGEDRATVKVTALVTGGRFLPERGERLDIESGWRLEDGEWRCYAATWTPKGT